MPRFFFDLDGVTDSHGIFVATAQEACAEATMAMPDFMAEETGKSGIRKWGCLIRNEKGGNAFRLTLTLRVEDLSPRPRPE